MAFQINPNIPLQAMDNPINIGDAFTKAQSYQTNALKLQALSEQFNEEKEARLRQKQMRQGIASELQKLQQGTPAQYRTDFFQTMPTGQMPQGMTGVLASERGQNIPTPDLFGENILKGNFDVRREMIAPEVKGVTPDYLDVLQIAAKHALQQNDIDSYVKFANGIKQERAAKDIEWGTNPTKGINPQTGLPDAYITNRKGDVKWLGSGVYEAPKDPKAPITWTVPNGRKETVYGYDANGKTIVLGVKSLDAPSQTQPRVQQVTNATHLVDLDTGQTKPIMIDGKPATTSKAANANAKAEAKIRQDLVADAANTTKTYANTMPILKKAKNIISRIPPDAWQSYYQSKIAGTPLSKYIGNEDQQKAIAELDVLQENLRLKAEKPAGAISNFEMGLLSKAMGVLKEDTSPSQKAAAFQTIIDVLENDNKTAINILKQNNASDFAYKGGEFLNRFTNKASREQRKEYLDAYMQVKNDPELLKELQENARDLGVLE